MLELLTDITEGRGTMKHLDMLQELADTISDTALCGLGKTAAFPVVSTMKYFVTCTSPTWSIKMSCRTVQGACQLLHRSSALQGLYQVREALPCFRHIRELKQPHTIDVSKCIKCAHVRTAARSTRSAENSLPA